MQQRQHRRLHWFIGILSSWVFWILFAGVLGFFVYGFTATGFMAGMLLAFVISVVSVIGIFPIIGVIIYWFWFAPYAINWGLQLAGNLQPSWLTWVIQLFGLALAIFATAIPTFWLLTAFT